MRCRPLRSSSMPTACPFSTTKSKRIFECTELGSRPLIGLRILHQFSAPLFESTGTRHAAAAVHAWRLSRQQHATGSQPNDAASDTSAQSRSNAVEHRRLGLSRGRAENRNRHHRRSPRSVQSDHEGEGAAQGGKTHRHEFAASAKTIAIARSSTSITNRPPAFATQKFAARCQRTRTFAAR